MADGLKRFEFRRNDRAFKVGDWLNLWEWRPLGSSYTGRSLDAEILYMLEGPAYGVPEGYAVLSLRILRIQEEDAQASPLVPFHYEGA
jgi:hypothetical protein